MSAKMGAFRSPNGIRKPSMKSTGKKPGLNTPAVMPSMDSGASMMPGMKKGGMAYKKGGAVKKNKKK